MWVQQTEYDFAGYHFESDDRIHVAWCDGGEYDPKGLEALEAAAFMGARWWTLDELMASDMPTVPYLLREHLPALIAGDLLKRADRHHTAPRARRPSPEQLTACRLSRACAAGPAGRARPGRTHARRPRRGSGRFHRATSVEHLRLGETDDAEGEGERPAGSMPSMSISSAMASAIDRSNPRTSTANSSSERTPSP